MELKNKKYFIDNISVLDICKEFDTPLYVYDAEKIMSQYQKITHAFKDTKVKIKYACKALTNINVLKLLKNTGCGIDASSIQEVLLSLKAGFEPEQIFFSPNGVAFEEIKEAVELGVQINIDNISILEQFGNHYGDKIPCSIRINPHIIAGGNPHIQTGDIDSKFGISFHQLRHILRIVKNYNIKVIGLHMHTGSDILDSSVFLNAMEVLLDVAKEFHDLKALDFGSGFKVAYRENDITTNIEELGISVSKRFNEFCKEYGKDLELWFEPGKFLVSEAGYFLTKVNVLKHTPSTVFAGVNSGFNHLIRPKLYDAYHNIINVSNPDGIKRVYAVVGNICEVDNFAWGRQIDEIREGDILVFFNAGAYCFSMSSNYNSRLRPAEVLIYNNKAHLIRERETLEDLINNQVEIEL